MINSSYILFITVQHKIVNMFELPQLPYEYSALEPYIDEQTMRLHHDKHHVTYVTNLNEALVGNENLLSMPIAQLLKNLDQVPEAVRTKVRNNGGGHANHSMFWLWMIKGGKMPVEKIKEALDSTFGSFDKFKETFAKAVLDRFGSGWVWLVSEKGKLNITDTPNQDTPLTEGKSPVLGLDVWEHAYYLKYQNRRADYVSAFWNVVNWQKVEELFSQTL